MPARPSRSAKVSSMGKRLSRTLSLVEALRLAAYARALRARRVQQMVYKPRMELWDDQGSPTVTAVFEVPGLRPEEVTVEVVDGRLVVSGERRPRRFEGSVASSESSEETNPLSSGRTDALQVRELKYGIFRRVVALPSGCITSDLDATMEHGMLTVSWPRHPIQQELRDVRTKSEEEVRESRDSSIDNVASALRFVGKNSTRSM